MTQENEAIVWYYDESGYYPYVMVMGTTDGLESIKASLTSSGIRCLLSGKSHRPADDGRTYNFYIRVAESIAGKLTRPAPHRISQALQGFPVTSRVDMQVQKVLSELSSCKLQLQRECEARKGAESILDTAKTQISRHHEELKTRDNEIRRLTDRLQTLKKVALERIEKVREDYQNQIDNLETRLPNRSDPIAGTDEAQIRVKLLSENAALKSNEVSLQVQLTEAMNEWERSDAERTRLAAELKEMENTKQHVIAELHAIKSEMAAPPTNNRTEEDGIQKAPSRMREGEFETLLNCLLPRLKFIPGSTSYLFHEISDFRNALEKLALINWNPDSVRNTVGVQGAPGWWRIRFSTGDSYRGRIYYRSEPERRTVKVLVSDKRLQNRDTKRLRKHG